MSSRDARAARLIAAILLSVLAWAQPALAAPAAVEPHEIMVTLDDLPPGFVLDPSRTSSSYLETVGPVQHVQYGRRISAETLPDPLFVVGQVIMRLDGPMGAGDALREVRDTFTLHQGMGPSPVGPNDDGTFTLERFDNNNIKICAVGFIKGNMIIVTLTGGRPEAATPERTLQIAGISSAKLDALTAR
jgi:hypothetical protein